MKQYHEKVKETLFNCINEMDKHRYLYAVNPSLDFTRQRKLSFKQLMLFLLHMGGNSIRKELMDYFDYDINTSTPSAFVQQRDKILPFAFEYLFHEFTNSFTYSRTYKGYRLLAVDGSCISIPHIPSDVDSHFMHENGKGYNLLHLNAIYDLCNNVYTDAIIQPRRNMNEYGSCVRMVDRSTISGKTILIADRGYECSNILAHIEQKGWNYLIRIKDVDSNGIISTLDLPDSDEFDVNFDMIFTRRRTKKEKSNPKLYKYIRSQSRFDYLDLNHNLYYPISFRVLRIKIKENSYETLITNLDKIQFSSSEIKQLYSLRWGIETSFRKLKYTIGLLNFHSKKPENIIKEILSRIIMYNFCEIIVANVVITTKSDKYTYKINFSFAVIVCKKLISRIPKARLPDIEALLGKNTIPIRNGRSSPRILNRTKSSVSFTYRVA